ncbi:MAG: hypothetical protein LBM00_07505 [Deltaproteobacteria bacterium]|jgi:hypothetical protein|nr:hypothetical protein [Deltaproteobacteria bacterium]
MRSIFTTLLLFTCLCLGATFSDLSRPSVSLASSESGEKAEKPESHELTRGVEEIIPLLQKAVDTHDAALAESLIDFDRISGSFLHDALPSINAAVASGKIKLQQPLPTILSSLNGGGIARKTAEQFLGAEAKKFVLYGVQSGYFAGTPRSPGEINRLDGGLFLPFAGKALGRKEFAPGFLAYEDARTAMLRTGLKDGGHYIDLDLLLQKREQSWIIVSIDNDDELLAAWLGK